MLERIRSSAYVAFSLASVLVFGCGSDEPDECVPGTSTGCDEGLVCERVQGGTPACFAPIFVEGRVFDALTDLGLPGATVVAIDANGAPASDVVESGAEGVYSLPVPTERDASGAPIAQQVTLRADAAGYQTFPSAPRTGIPIELSSAVDGVVTNAATDIALFERDERGSGVATVRGTVEGVGGGGVLVVAEQSDRAVSSAISGSDGSFVLFDVPTSSTTIRGYAAGVRITSADVSAIAPETTGVRLTATTEGLTTITGAVQIVNAPGGSQTSVIMVLESTFVESTARGESPPGLRDAPVSGAFEIAGVAPGRYVVLAGFENDGLVRDPDTGIGGTEIVHIEVPEGGGTMELAQSFKVTEALAVLSPGAETIETVTTSTPIFRWEDDSSEDGYELRVYDAYGNELLHEPDLPNVSGGTPEYTWTGASLEPGMVYQFRVWSFRDRSGGRTLISATEDLRGVFVYEP